MTTTRLLCRSITLHKNPVLITTRSSNISMPGVFFHLKPRGDFSRISHAFYRLTVHFPDEQLVYFQADSENEAVQRALTRQTHLTAWFKLNATYVNAQQYLYSQNFLIITFSAATFIAPGHQGKQDSNVNQARACTTLAQKIRSDSICDCCYSTSKVPRASTI